MTEEYIYDRQRIMMVIMIASIIVCAGVVIAGLWPKPVPKIGNVTTDVTVITNSYEIGEKYTELFGSSVNTNNTIMVKINVYAASMYYAERLIFILEHDGFCPIIATAIVQMSNEANILSGKNDFPFDQLTYANSLMITPENYVIYFIMDTFEGTNFHYNVIVGE